VSGRLVVVRAAAGSGKTTDLALRYLRLVADGVPVENLVAITFTRRAAAELIERVSLALRASGEGPAATAARAHLGAVWERYEQAAPTDPELRLRALEGLPDAPIGTTDGFVQRLLTEFAVDAALPLPEGDPVPLDVPIQAGRGVGSSLDRAARRLLDPPDGGLDPEVAPLLRHLTLDQIRHAVVKRTPDDALPPAAGVVVMAQLATDLARALAQHDLLAAWAVPVPADEAAIAEALRGRTSESGKWAVPAVASWIAAGAPIEAAPYELAGWLVGLNVRSKARKAIRTSLQETVRDFGMGRLSLWDVVQAMEYPYDQEGHLHQADAIRAGLHRLRQRVLRVGLREAAHAGELGYDEWVEAAIALCADPPARMVGRFRALLVDEVQDANAAQLRLYQALAALPTGPGAPPMTAYFVGDSRQSIYLFRHAEPQGLVDLAQQSGADTEELLVNHRSAPLLVQAHRALFGALDSPMRRQRWSPPAALDTLQWRSDQPQLALSAEHHEPTEPVLLVSGRDLKQKDADRAALWRFWCRVQAARGEPGHAGDTAVVLTTTWSAARNARDQLRRWAGDDGAAWVDGATGWASGRVGSDLKLWLRALVDPADDIAWLAVLKHPSIGLSDLALARIRAGVGLQSRDDEAGWVAAPGRCARLGWTIDCDRLAAPHDDDDRAAFDAAVGPLRDARRDLGTRGTARILERLVTALRWRVLLMAGPGGRDDAAQLEVLLDWVRALDDEGTAAGAIAAHLASGELEAPRIHLQRPGAHVTCTTVYQAKGIAWDHVCVLRPGATSRQPVRDAAAWMALAGERVRLEGVHFDPYGGVTPHADPMGRLGARLHAHRRAEESARVLYVAVTRARRSVTLGIGTTSARRDEGPRDVAQLLKEAWLQPDWSAPGVVRVPAETPPEAPAPAPAWVAADPSVPALPSVPTPTEGIEERAPSSMGAHLSSSARRQLAESVVARVRLAGGLHLGGAEVAPRTGRLPHLHATDWGELAHSWLAEWQFAGTPDAAALDAWLARTWGAADPDVHAWLAAVSTGLARVGGPLWDTATSPGARLHFELPLVGLGEQLGRQVLLSGRVDLCIEPETGGLWIVDFKAGGQFPTGYDDLQDGASLRTYAPQLAAYAQALRRMGQRVDGVALWFVRTGTSVIWRPA